MTTKRHIINNLKTVKRQLKKIVGRSWVNEIIWIEDAVRYLEEIIVLTGQGGKGKWIRKN